MTAYLMPCPFCGETKTLIEYREPGTILHPWYRIECDHCGAKGPGTDKGDHAEKWNRRGKPEAIKPAPWYPDDSGEWVEVPDDLMEMPDGLKGGDMVDVLLLGERERKKYRCGYGESAVWAWCFPPKSERRIVAYRKVGRA